MEGLLGYINLADVRDEWLAFVNTVMNVGVYEIRGICGLSEELSACQERFCAMELVHRCVKKCEWEMRW
jgi:hypothetical protein